MMEVDYTVLFTMVKTILKSPLLHLLITVIFFDILTGITKAIALKKLNSKISSVGMMKHFVVIAMVITVGTFSMIFDVRPFSYLFCIYYICTYGVSLLENYEAIGLPFPTSLKPFFEQMRENTDENLTGQIKADHIKVEKIEVKEVSKTDGSNH